MKKKFNMKNLDDYNPPKSDRPDFTDGEYQVKGVKFFRDKNDNPILRLFGDKLRVGINYILEDGSIGPFGTMELYKINVLQNAFNKEAQFQIPPDESDAPRVGEFLKQVEYNINAADTMKTLTVANGYAAFVNGQQVPANCDYHLKLVDVLTRDDAGEPTYTDGKWYERFQVQMEIQSPGKFGHPFAGCRFKCWIPYGFKIVNGEPQWTLDKEGKRSSASWVAYNFYKLTAPDMFQNELTDENIVRFWYSFAKIPSDTFKIYVKANIGNYGEIYYNPQWRKAEIIESESLIDKEDIPDDFFKTANDEQKKVDEPAFERKVLTDDEMDVESRTLFIRALSALSDNKLVSDGYQLNDTGKQTAKKYLTPLSDNGKIKPMKIADMRHEHVMSTMNVLFDSLNHDEKKMIAEYLQEVEEMLIGVKDGGFDTGDDEW